MLYVLIVAYLIAASGGLVLFKLGNQMDPIATSITSGHFMLQVSWVSLLGIACYCCSFLLNLALVSKYNLSYVVPITTGLMYTLVILSSVFVFGESMTWVKIIGSALIIAGVILINLHQ